jgi:hypothetical protein
MAKATIGGETLDVDADGFPATYDLTGSPELVPDATPDTTDTSNTGGNDMAATATATEKPDTNGKPKAEKPAPRMKVPGPTNTPVAKAKPAPKAEKAAGKIPTIYRDPEGEKRRELPLDQLTFDKRVQMRASLHNEVAVEEYADLYRDNPDALPAVRVIEVPEAEREEFGLKTPFVVWDGFQRGEARQRAKLGSIPVLVAKGTWEQARGLALRANSGHGLQRSPADIKRALHALLDDETMLAKVLKSGKGRGGANRAIAAAAGISKGSVHKYLRAIGKGTKGDVVVNLPKPRTEATTAEPGTVPEATRRESDAAIKSRKSAALIHEMEQQAAAMIRRYRALLTRADARNLLIAAANDRGIPVTVDENAKTGADGQPTAVTKTEYWAAIDSLALALADLREQFEKMGVGKSN